VNGFGLGATHAGRPHWHAGQGDAGDAGRSVSIFLTKVDGHEAVDNVALDGDRVAALKLFRYARGRLTWVRSFEGLSSTLKPFCSR